MAAVFEHCWPAPSKRSGADFATASLTLIFSFTALSAGTRRLRRRSTQFANVEYLISASCAIFAPLRSNSTSNA